MEHLPEVQEILQKRRNQSTPPPLCSLNKTNSATSNDQAKQDFIQFVQKHPRFIVKPVADGLGKGIKVFEYYENEDINKFYENLQEEYETGAIIEELIIQSKDMAKFHPQSVNTIRVPTFRFKDEVVQFPSFALFGTGDRCISNGYFGGIISLIDLETGVVVATGDEFGNKFILHPDTKEQIIGFKIPEWDKAKALVKELAQVVPECRYVGWDLAHTDDGWVMVEGNERGQFVCWQITSQKGFRPEMEKILKRFYEENCRNN